MRYEITSEGCWLWQGDRTDQGYGRLMIDSRLLYAHRVAYQLHVGPIPRGQQIDHLCRNRACTNPEHLEVVTSRENSMRGNHPLYVLARKSQCSRGHDMTNDANVYVRKDGRRRCRVCQIEGQRARRQRARDNP